MALFIIACSAAKHQGPLAAGLKYDSRQHRALFQEFFLEGAYCSHDAMILSAKLGLIPLTQTVEDYDLLMDDERAAQLATCPSQRAILERAIVEQDEVYVYGGKLYRETVKKVLADVGFNGQVIEVVGQDRGCGDHFGALKDLFLSMSAEA